MSWSTFKIIAVTLSSSLLVAAPMQAWAQEMSMWLRSGANPIVKTLIQRWNTQNPDRPIKITEVPHTEMVPTFGRAVAAGKVPDLLSLDLIYGPQFEKAGAFIDLTDKLAGDPHLKTASPGHMKTATYGGRIYGVPMYADVSLLIWNKDLFQRAGLDPESPPRNIDEIYQYAKKIHALGNDISGYYFAGSCSGCNIFTVAPLMWATGARVEPLDKNDEPLVGDGIKSVLQWGHKLVSEGLVPASARAETGANFAGAFTPGKIGMMGHGNFVIGELAKNNPKLNYGITLLPGVKTGQTSSFAGGDIVLVPKGSKREKDGVAFMKWLLSDDTQIEGYAANMDMVTRGDLSNNKYYDANPKVQAAAKAIAVANTPYTLKFFELINSPQSPWLEMLQRSLYDGEVDAAIADAKVKMKAIMAE